VIPAERPGLLGPDPGHQAHDHVRTQPGRLSSLQDDGAWSAVSALLGLPGWPFEVSTSAATLCTTWRLASAWRITRVGALCAIVTVRVDLPAARRTRARRTSCAVSARSSMPTGRPALRRVGIGHWRHTAVSHMSNNGVPIQDIADTVGHKSTHVTETVYRHVIAPAIRGGASVMDDVFGDDDIAADHA
jgi:hypothetical protein